MSNPPDVLAALEHSIWTAAAPATPIQLRGHPTDLASAPWVLPLPLTPNTSLSASSPLLKHLHFRAQREAARRAACLTREQFKAEEDIKPNDA